MATYSTNLVNMSTYRAPFLLIVLWAISALAVAQSAVDYWETVVFNDDIWSYRVGMSAPPPDWMQPQFDDSVWARGMGGFGYGDGDDNTIVPTTISLYIRIKFDLADTAKIQQALLHADYDDAFVAYWNGVEFARGNFGSAGTPPDFDEIPSVDHEATLYTGGVPEAFVIDSLTFKQLAQEGENTLAIQIHNYLITSSDLSSNFFLSLGLHDDSMDYEPTPAWFYEPFIFHSSNLPLFKINTSDQVIFDEPKIVANLQIVDNGQGATNALTDPATDYDGQIAIEIRGASSQLFSKKNYGFETQLSDGANNNVSLLGMPEENDWILHGPFSDKSLIRNALTFQIGRDLMDYASRTKFCELVINNNYQGVYLLMEKIKRDKNRVDIATLRPEDIAGDELTGGYIIQLDRDDESTEEDGWYSPHGSRPFYAYHSPNYRQLMPVQKDYMQNWMTDFERAMLQQDFATTYEDYIDVNSFIDYFLINELTKHIDAFKLSFYMYKQKDSNGGKLHLGPIWDFNLGYGNFNFGCDETTEGWIHPCTSRAFWLNKIVGIDAVQNRMYCRWQELRQKTLSTDFLLNRIDSLVQDLGPAVEQNFAQFHILGRFIWPNSFIGDTHAAEINFLRYWLIQRLNWMDNNMFGNPNFNCDALVNAQPRSPIPQLEIAPNPSADEITFSLKNGGNKHGEILLFNTLGHLITRFELSKEHTLNDQDLAIGLYFYVYQQNGQVVQQGKLVKQ